MAFFSPSPSPLHPLLLIRHSQTAIGNIPIPHIARTPPQLLQRQILDHIASMRALFPRRLVLDAPRAGARQARRPSGVPQMPGERGQVRVARHAVQLRRLGASRHQSGQEPDRLGQVEADGLGRRRDGNPHAAWSEAGWWAEFVSLVYSLLHPEKNASG